MNSPLAHVASWTPDTVIVGVTGPSATLDTHGDVDLRLPFASVTKPLTATAVLLAAQQGRLHLDEPAGPPGAHPEVTVRHLLAHASGLPPARGGVISAPERRRIYSDWGYEVLGELVAERAGRPFADELEREVLTPLGMNSTRLTGPAGSGAVGTVADLLRFARELLAPRLLEPERWQEATRVAYPGLEGVLPGFGRQSPNDWGLGLERKGSKRPHWTGERLSSQTFGHFGRSGSFVWVDPTRQLACVELADREFGPWAAEVWPGFSDAIVAAYAPDEPDTALSPDAAFVA